MKLDVPDAERDLLARWLTTTDEPAEKVLSALETATPTLRPSGLARQIADATDVPFDKADELLFAFFNLSSTLAKLNEEEKSDPHAILFRSIVGDVTNVEKRQLFGERIARITACESLQITGKALLVQRDNPNSYCTARTLSELRPVFSEGGLEPQAAVIVHQLKIVYHAGPKHERSEVFISMDRTDVEQLQRVLKRALEKDRQLAEATKKLEVQLLQ